MAKRRPRVLNGFLMYLTLHPKVKFWRGARGSLGPLAFEEWPKPAEGQSRSTPGSLGETLNQGLERPRGL
jgi:hypothetical protein